MRTYFDPSMTLMGKPNVVWKDKRPTQTAKLLYLALNNLVATRPQWKFDIVSTSSYHVGVIPEIVAREINIYYCDGNSADELMGNVCVMMHGSEMKLFVSNERIAVGRKRGRMYKTTDPEKAALQIRKYFYPSSKDELLSKALEDAGNFISSESNNKAASASNSKSHLFLGGCGAEFVFRHIDMYLQQYPQKRGEYEKYIARQEVANVTDSVYRAFVGKGAFVVLVKGRSYVVMDLASESHSADTYTDDTLPFHLRKCIGLLKLVEEGQMISDIGCRVDDSVMVVLKDKGE